MVIVRPYLGGDSCSDALFFCDRCQVEHPDGSPESIKASKISRGVLDSELTVNMMILYHA